MRTLLLLTICLAGSCLASSFSLPDNFPAIPSEGADCICSCDCTDANCGLDVYFMLDAASCLKDRWNEMLDRVSDLAVWADKNYKWKSEVDFTVMRYTDKVDRPATDIEFRSTDDYATFEERLSLMRKDHHDQVNPNGWLNEGSFLDRGLTTLDNRFSSFNHNGRKVVIIVMTNGKSHKHADRDVAEELMKKLTRNTGGHFYINTIVSISGNAFDMQCEGCTINEDLFESANLYENNQIFSSYWIGQEHIPTGQHSAVIVINRIFNECRQACDDCSCLCGAYVEVAAAGEPGEPGEPGRDGRNWPGEPGKDGGCGEDGPPGHPGNPGEPGDPGHHGEPGPEGPRGGPGLDGKKGPRGETGGPGGKGPDGTDGLRGAPGRDGKDGDDGLDGQDGDDGDKGVDGPAGLHGIPGGRGSNGKDGKPGSNGRPGQPGHDGPDGVPGEQGDAGRRGDDGEPGARGYIGIRGDNGEPGNPGEDGEKGDPGVKGMPGPHGFRGVFTATDKDTLDRWVDMWIVEFVNMYLPLCNGQDDDCHCHIDRNPLRCHNWVSNGEGQTVTEIVETVTVPEKTAEPVTPEEYYHGEDYDGDSNYEYDYKDYENGVMIQNDMDLAFLVEASESIITYDWKLITEWIKRFIEIAESSRSGRVSSIVVVCRFQESPARAIRYLIEKQIFNLREELNNQNVFKEILTGQDSWDALNVINNNYYDTLSRDSDKVLITITDGVYRTNTQKTISEQEEIMMVTRGNFPIRIAIGIGSETDLKKCLTWLQMAVRSLKMYLSMTLRISLNLCTTGSTKKLRIRRNRHD